MTGLYPIQTKEILVPVDVAERVLTVGPDHINYRGGIGSVMNVYARHFSVYKYVTSHKSVRHKWQLIPFFLQQYSKFIALLRKDKSIQIIHLQASSHGSFYRKLVLFVTAKYGFGKRVIYHMHGSRFEEFYYKSDPFSRYLIRFLIERADLVICLSAYWQNFFTQNFRVRRLTVLGNVIHRRKQIYKGLNHTVRSGPLRVLFLGAIGHRKGIFDLLDVIVQHRTVFDGRLILRIGGNGEVKRLQAYIDQYKLESIVQFEGWVTGKKKHELLSTSDVYILPSYHEGLPLSILEAMNYNLPIISTPVGGTPEVVYEGVNGYLVQPGEKFAIYQRLVTFVDQPERIQQMGAESGRIIKEYQPEAILPQLNKLYTDLLNL